MRSRLMTSTVLGTSTMARAVRVAVTTTRSNSAGSPGAGSACAGCWARTAPGQADARNNNRETLGRIAQLARKETGGGWRPARAGERACLERGAPGAPRDHLVRISL